MVSRAERQRLREEAKSGSRKPKKSEKGKRRNLDDEDVEMGSSSEEEELSLDSDEDDDDAKKLENDEDWDDECYVCGKDSGGVLCCESCPRVCHFECTGLRKKPEKEWYCNKCSNKQQATSNVRSIRNARR